LSYAPDISVKIALIHHVTLTFDLWPFNPKTTSFYTLPKVILYIKFEQFGIIRFLVVRRTNKQTDRQTNKQKTRNVLPTPIDIVDVDNFSYIRPNNKI